MASSVEAIVAMQYAYDTLYGDLALRAAASINVVPEPAGVSFPRVIIEAPASAGELTALENGATLIWANPMVQVTVLGDDGTPWSDLAPIAGRVNTLLHGTTQSAAVGGTIYSFVRRFQQLLVDAALDKRFPKIVQRYDVAAKAS